MDKKKTLKLFDETTEMMALIHNTKISKNTTNKVHGQPMIMYEIYKSGEDGIAPTILAKKIKVGSSRIANALKKLEEYGYIKRVSSKDDHRKTNVILTKDGLNQVKEARDEMLKDFKKILKNIGEDNYIKYLYYCKLVLKACSEVFKKKGDK